MVVDATANQARQRRSTAGRLRHHQQQQQQQQKQQQPPQQRVALRRRQQPRPPPLDRSSISSALLDTVAGRGGGGGGGDDFGRLRQFPRSRLRVVEKIGEGSFGMVSEGLSDRSPVCSAASVSSGHTAPEGGARLGFWFSRY